MNENYREGKRDEKYGGIITDMRKLPIGTKFYVHNGSWNGEIASKNTIMILKDNKPLYRKISDIDPYLSISITEQKGNIIEICTNCYHGEICSADNRIAARTNGFCNSFENKTEILKLPYTIGRNVIERVGNQVVLTLY